MALSAADQAYYDRVVAAPADYNISDLRRAYYIGVLSGDVTPGGPLSTFEQYLVSEAGTEGTELNSALVEAVAVSLTDTTLVEDPDDEGTYIIVPS